MLACQVYGVAPASFCLPRIDHHRVKDPNLDISKSFSQPFHVKSLAGTLPRMSP